MGERWYPIPIAPIAYINLEGEVLSGETNEIVVPEQDPNTNESVVSIPFDDDKVLRVPTKFCYMGSVIFTSIANEYNVTYRDGDPMNVALSNLQFIWVGPYGMNYQEVPLKEHVDGTYVLDRRHNKPVRVIETGEVYVSVAECAREMGLKGPNIHAALRGRLNHVSGFTFEWVD